MSRSWCWSPTEEHRPWGHRGPSLDWAGSGRVSWSWSPEFWRSFGLDPSSAVWSLARAWNHTELVLVLWKTVKTWCSLDKVWICTSELGPCCGWALPLLCGSWEVVCGKLWRASELIHLKFGPPPLPISFRFSPEFCEHLSTCFASHTEQEYSLIYS